MQATFTGFKMWPQAVTQARSTAVDAVRDAMHGQAVDARAGYAEDMHRNQPLSKPAMIGEIQADGPFNVVWKTPTAIVAENWSPFIPENAAPLAVRHRIGRAPRSTLERVRRSAAASAAAPCRRSAGRTPR